MRNFLSKNWPVLICLILAALVTWPLLAPGYFSHHDDLQVMRIYEMKKCLLDLQIPCRWVPDMGYGNGYPLFNYYAVFPYYIGAIASFFVSFLTSAKLLFAIPIFLGAVSMFVLAKELFGVYPGILSSVLYTYAPYRALDLYVRGDITESFAIAIIPLCLYFALKVIKSGNKYNLIGLSVSLAIFLTSHNIMTVLFMPVFLLITTYWLIIEHKRNIKSLAGGIIIGVSLAAFFIFPAYFEKNLVQIDNLIKHDLNFRAHFITVNQLFLDRNWDYGASVLGNNDTLSFQIGWLHWVLVVISIFVFIIKSKFGLKFNNLLPGILIVVFCLSVFMTHAKSAFIWEKIEVLKFTQFPWRFLAISIFAASLLGGYLIQNLTGNYRKLALLILVITTIVLNWSYFKPKEFYFDITDQKKLSGKLWDDQKKAAILDYLPQTAVEPKEPAPGKPILRSGDAVIDDFKVSSNRWQFRAKVFDNAVVEVPVLDFPIWKVTANGQQIDFSNKNYLGRISINLKQKGEYQIYGKFTNTLLRQYSNIISLLSLIVLFIIGIYGKNNKNFK